MYNTFSLSINLMSTNVQPFSTLLSTVFSIFITGFNQYTIGIEGFKFQPSSKSNRSMKDNIYKKWIKEIYTYMSYYKKRNVFVDKKEKIDFIQEYLKDITKRVWIIY